MPSMTGIDICLRAVEESREECVKALEELNALVGGLFQRDAFN